MQSIILPVVFMCMKLGLSH